MARRRKKINSLQVGSGLSEVGKDWELFTFRAMPDQIIQTVRPNETGRIGWLGVGVGGNSRALQRVPGSVVRARRMRNHKRCHTCQRSGA
ncbi:hypothetical protein ZHAS_00003363 [Anopheles sinensis]|uniref:Uncharacterized protein n=1 Tax=Anopheles sinensis TaxID=74873 RepID=A0A084VE48_ANOSI|nr:hypothetical protein ZHAS_00003363 [Anopheles sinensis]